MKKLSLSFKRHCEFCKIWLPLIVLLIAGFYLAWQFVPAAASKQITIAVGGTSGDYYDYAMQYQQNIKADAIDLNIMSVEGSVEALQKLRGGEADFALVQGGVAHSTMPDAAEEGLQSIASLFYEPLWVFYRKELGEVQHIHTLKGKRLGIGKQGSGTQVLVSQLLNDNDLCQKNSNLQALLMDDAASKLMAGELDAMFLMTLPQTEIIQQLITHPDITLMDFRHQVIAYTSHYPFLSQLTLGEGIIDLRRNLPNHDITLLSTTATLVAKKDLHTDHVRLLSREALKVHGRHGLLEKPREFPSIDHLEIPIHPTAAQYLQNGPSFLEKIFPFWLAARIDQLKVMLIPLLTLLIPLSKGIMPLYQWRIRSRIYPWYKMLSQLDRQLDNLDLPTTEQEITRINKLHGELANSVSVPLAHMHEFYQLRTHTDHILTRLKERRSLLLGNTPVIAPVPVMPPTEPVPALPEEPIATASEITQATAPEPAALATDALPISKFRIRPFWKGRQHSEEGNTANTPDVLADSNLPEPPPATVISPADLTAIQTERHQQAQRIVRKHLLAGAAMSAIPIPMLDVAALTSTQLHLLDKLSQHYAVGFDKKLAKAKLFVLLSSTLPTTTIIGLSSLTKLIPGIGTLGGGASLSALSGAVIYATGSVFIHHFEAGGTLENFDGQQQTTAFREALQTRLSTQRIKATA